MDKKLVLIGNKFIAAADAKQWCGRVTRVYRTAEGLLLQSPAIVKTFETLYFHICSELCIT